MDIEDLITEMKAVKADNTSLSVIEVLKIFEIRAMINLTNELRGIRFK